MTTDEIDEADLHAVEATEDAVDDHEENAAATSSSSTETPLSGPPLLGHVPPGPWNHSWAHFSDTPAAVRPPADSSKAPPCILGVDEAGRGPVLGPMVYAVSYAPVDSKNRVEKIGFDDSKVLKEKERDGLFDRLAVAEAEWIGWAVKACTPMDISEAMLRRSKCSLNEIAFEATAELISGVLDRGVNVQEVYVDTVGPPDAYQARLSRRFPRIGMIKVAKKADSLYPIVSAASICAKVTRDSMLRHWVFAEPGLAELQSRRDAAATLYNFGSGYPSDPKTTAWLRAQMDPVFGFPRIARFAWSTVSKMLEPEAVLPPRRSSAGASSSSSVTKKKAAFPAGVARVVWEDDSDDEGGGDAGNVRSGGKGQRGERDAIKKWVAAGGRKRKAQDADAVESLETLKVASDAHVCGRVSGRIVAGLVHCSSF